MSKTTADELVVAWAASEPAKRYASRDRAWSRAWHACAARWRERAADNHGRSYDLALRLGAAESRLAAAERENSMLVESMFNATARAEYAERELAIAAGWKALGET